MPLRSQRHLRTYEGAPGPIRSIALSSLASKPNNLLGQVWFDVVSDGDARMRSLNVYFVKSGQTLDKAVNPMMRATIPSQFFNGQVYVGDPSIVNLIPDGSPNLVLGRQWSFAGGKYTHANTNLFNRCMVSSDGINFRAISTPPDVQIWDAVAYAPELGRVCAIASSGGTPVNNRAMISNDGGETWAVQNQGGSFAGREICWGGPPGDRKFVAVSSVAATSNILTSSDGITWQGRNKPSTGLLQSVCWSQELGLFVAVGPTAGTTTHVSTSSDGITWFSQTSPDNAWQAVCWSPELGLFVALATGGGAIPERVMTSPNGVNWTARPSANDGGNWVSICWGGGRFVGVGTTGGTGARAMVSTDGINWTVGTPTAPISAVAWTAVCWSPTFNKYYAVNNGGGSWRHLWSTDGLNWFTNPNSPNQTSNGYRAICEAAGRIIAVADGNGINPELVSWTGLGLKTTDVIRYRVNFITPALSVGYQYNNPGRVVVPLAQTGVWRSSFPPTQDANAFGFYSNTDVFGEFNQQAMFKQTPLCAPRDNSWDLYVFPSNEVGIEGPGAAPITNVMVV